MSDVLRVGIVGAGMIAGCHSRAWSATPGVEVVAVCDPHRAKADALAATTGARVVDDLAALLDLDVGVVSVCTPPRTHVALARRALQAGRHVLCEKPVALDLADARRLAEVAHAAGTLLSVGHVSRFEAEHAAAKQAVDEGLIGRVVMASHSMTSPFPAWSEGGWLGDPQRSGGPLLDLAVHSFDFLAWVIGSPAVRVRAVAADTGVGPATYALATVRYASGAMGQVETSWAHPGARGFQLAAELVGTQGRVTWDYASMSPGALHLSDGTSERLDPLGERGFAAETAAFAAAVRAGGPAPVPVEAGLAALRTAVAARHSLTTGQPVDLTTWEVA